MKSIVKNGRIIGRDFNSHKRLDIYMENGIIRKIGENLEENEAEVLDADGKYILPGFIDMHCNVCDPGYEYIEDIETASCSAAKGGFTSITCEPNTNPAIDNKTVVEYIVSKSKEYSLVNIFPYGSMSVGCLGEHMAEIGEMHEAGIVGIADGGRSIMNASFLANVFRYSKMFDMPVLTHCEDKNLAGKGVMNEGYMSTSLGLLGIPKEAEEVIVTRNIILAEGMGAKLHIANVTTKGSVQLIREAKKRGTRITCETSPHYFLLTEEAVENYNTLAKVKPPLRTKEDVKAIIEGILDGTIDVITSGHSPTKLTDKNKEFDNADYGISAFETAFALSYTKLVEQQKVPLSKLVELLSTKPAKILGLNKKGRIAEGMDGDLVVVDLNEKYTINPQKFVSKAKFSPFAGKEVKGKVICTIVGGRILT